MGNKWIAGFVLSVQSYFLPDRADEEPDVKALYDYTALSGMFPSSMTA